MGPVLAVVPHPDDEAWAMAATLARLAQTGASVTLVCATRGEGGGDAAEREAELERSAQILGVEELRIWTHPDGRLEEDAESLGRALDSLLGERAWALVLSLDWDGGYGHVDHLALTRALHQAHRRQFGSTGPTLLLTSAPEGVLSRVRRALRRAAPRILAEGLPNALGIKEADAALSVPVRELRDLKIQSVAAHASQLVGGNPWSFLNPAARFSPPPLEGLLWHEPWVHAGGASITAELRRACASST